MPVEVTEGSTHSADGTRIGFRRLGTGPAVVFVHGSVSTHTDWMPVARLLADRFTCFAMDRRGRAKSGWGVGPYSIEREYEDIEAVLAVAKAETGTEAALAAHSYGAICALGVAMRQPVSRLVLYEPPLPVGGLIAGENLTPYVAAIEQGELDKALEWGLARFPRMPSKTIDALRSSKAWPRLRVNWLKWMHIAPMWNRTAHSPVRHYCWQEASAQSIRCWTPRARSPEFCPECASSGCRVKATLRCAPRRRWWRG